ncbi:TPA: hypothetical protein RM800_003976 [Yersinia enterocolitica]|nr:hypothetical protein [Yersinia enterocolitica]HEM6608331.1 hypothetical protein [Yersinia enterocolitica]HEN4721381.1 hypothetical protein [Yersinia enterocolitica]
MVKATASAIVANRSEKVNIMDVLASASYSDIIATIAMIVAFIAVPASGYISYHYAIKGERRKEFNSVAEPIMMSLFEQFNSVSEGYFPSNKLTNKEIYSLKNVSGKKLRSQINADFSAYEAAIANSGTFDEWNKFTYSSDSSREALHSAIQQLMKSVERR